MSPGQGVRLLGGETGPWSVREQVVGVLHKTVFSLTAGMIIDRALSPAVRA
jgi:hypothetical protein